MLPLHYTPAHKLHEARLQGRINTEQIVRSVFDQIDKAEDTIGAFLCVLRENALSGAQAVDRKLAAGDPVGLWEGMPISVKDIFMTKGIPTTCGSKILKDFVPPFESHVTQKLLEAGCHIIGKTNLDEFAMGGSTENSGYKTTRNPLDVTRVPGGSSGGSAASVAAGMALASIGTDTGGSIRQPAALTGLVGVKPTYGRVSRFGMTAFASSLEQAGPITRDVRDAGELLNLISGYDPRDSTSLRLNAPDFCQEIDKDIAGLKIGRIVDLDMEAATAEVKENFENSLVVLEQAGAEIVDIRIPNVKHAVAAYYVIGPAEASSNLGRFDGIRYGHRADTDTLLQLYEQSRDEGFGEEVKLRILTGAFVLSSGYYETYYGKAQQAQSLIRSQFIESFAKVDVIATPVSPEVAFKVGEKTADPITMYLMDAFTIPANLAGIPGIAVPSGYNAKNLPIGLQFLAAHGNESVLFRAAGNVERLFGVPYPTPELSSGQPLTRPTSL